MTVERRIEDNGAITDIITLTPEENNAMDEAHEIVSKRYAEMELEQTDWEKKMLEYTFQGIIRFEGVESMLNYARTAIISKGEKAATRGYC